MSENEKIAEDIAGLADRSLHCDLKPKIIKALDSKDAELAEARKEVERLQELALDNAMTFPELEPLIKRRMRNHDLKIELLTKQLEEAQRERDACIADKFNVIETSRQNQERLTALLESSKVREESLRKMLLRARINLGELCVGGEFANQVKTGRGVRLFMASDKEWEQAKETHDEIVKFEALAEGNGEANG